MKKLLLICTAAALLAGCGSTTANTNANTNSTNSVANTNQPCGDLVCDSAETADPTLCPQDCGGRTTPANTNTTNSTTNTNAATTIDDTGSVAASYTFTADAGERMTGASNAGVKFSTADTMELLYQDNTVTAGNTQKIASATASSDWLNFTVSDANANGDNFRALKLPDGTCRAYGFNTTKGLTNGETGLTSRSSTDCVTFTQDSGNRYDLQSADNGTLGVYDLFNDSKGGVVLMYIGDMLGLNNVRRAYSTDNGMTFTFTNGDVLGDDNAGGGNNSYVDEKTAKLANGNILLVTMKAGSVYSFVSTDDGKTFTKETGVRLQPSDFTGMNLVSLNDPQIIALPDGRYRIYMTGTPADKTALASIVSATSN
jgi:hypothetical protein